MLEYKAIRGDSMTKHELLQWKAYLDMYGLLSDNFGPFSRIYSMTTENILEFINKVDCLDKDVLTVTGSGDQAMNAILNGAKNITCFDINPITFCQLNLKKEAIKTLSLDEFIRFFNLDKTSSNYTFLDEKLFEKVAKDLDSTTLNVFKHLYKYFSNTKDLYNGIYFNFDYDYSHLKNMNNYLTQTNYDKLSSILRSNSATINFIECDFLKLKEKIGDKKFDLIMLSNISDYIEFMYDNRPLNSFLSDINNLSENLNELGIMEVGYIYYHPIYGRLIGVFNDKQKRQAVFNTDRFHSRFVSAYDDIGAGEYSDQIITYQKF